MTGRDPIGELDDRFGSSGAVPTTWAEAWSRLEKAEIYWLSTVRADGQPTVSPLVGVCLDGRIFFTTGPTEQKTVNLRSNPRCVLTTGDNRLADGLDIVIEGSAVLVTDEATLRVLSAGYEVQYPPIFHFPFRDGSLQGGGGGEVLAFEIKPSKVFAFGRGAEYSQTRWRFPG